MSLSKYSFKLSVLLTLLVVNNAYSACSHYDTTTKDLNLTSVAISKPSLSNSSVVMVDQFVEAKMKYIGECPYDTGFDCLQLDTSSIITTNTACTNEGTFVVDNQDIDLDISGSSGNMSVYYGGTKSLEVPEVLEDGEVAYSDIRFTLTTCPVEVDFFGETIQMDALACFRVDELVETEDTRPDAFTFAPEPNATAGEYATSENITPTTFNTAASVTIVNGEYDINEQEIWTNDEGTINPGDTIRVRHIAATEPNTQTTTTLIIDVVSGEFTSTTAP